MEKGFSPIEPTESSPRSPVHNLFELSEGEKISLRERIIKNQGSARIFIHPYASENYQDDNLSQKDETRIAAIGNVLGQIASMPKEKAPVTLIMEEWQFLDNTKKKLTELAADGTNDLYCVPTILDSSMPLFDQPPVEWQGEDGEQLQYEYFDENQNANWSKFVEKLKELGVKKIILGGTDLFIFKPTRHDDTETYDFSHFHSQREQKGAKSTDYLLDKCVGLAVPHLSQEFEVEISQFSSPDNKEDLLRVERGEDPRATQ